MKLKLRSRVNPEHYLLAEWTPGTVVQVSFFGEGMYIGLNDEQCRAFYDLSRGQYPEAEYPLVEWIPDTKEER